MRKETLSLVYAIGIGVLIGGALGQYASAHYGFGGYMWGLFALIGGLCGYCAVDAKEFVEGVKRAYARATTWSPDWLYWSAFAASFLGGLVAFGMMFMAMGLFLPWRDHDTMIVGSKAMAFIVSFGALFFAIVIQGPKPKSDSRIEEYRERLEGNRQNGSWMALNLNPIGLALWAFRGLIAGVCWTPFVIGFAWKTGKSFLSFMRGFLWNLILEVHSTRRALAFIWAAVGVFVTWKSGNMLVGAIAGMAFGALHYEIVSVRILKVAPVRTR